MLYPLITFIICFSLTRNNQLRFACIGAAVLLVDIVILSGNGFFSFLFFPDLQAILSVIAIIVFYNFNKKVLFIKKNDFGFIKVLRDEKLHVNKLYNGRIVHGSQCMDKDLENIPVSYFHETGPIGQVFELFQEEIGKKKVAVIGLGTGSLAAYIKPMQEIDFYEINPLVKEVAENPKFFTYLKNCKGKVKTLIGDGLEIIKSAKDKEYFLVIIDVYVDGVIPDAFISPESIKTFLQKMEDNGLLVFHATSKDEATRRKITKALLASGLFTYLNVDDEIGFFLKEKSDWVLSSKNWEISNKLDLTGKWERKLS